MNFTPRRAVYIIAILHVVGMFGLNSSYKEFFLLLTPLNLLSSTILFLFTSKELNIRSYSIFLLVAILGFAVELVGVNTGFPFGVYEYGPVLGPKLINTPLMIGVNWVMLVISTMLIARLITQKTWAVATIGASLMTFLDFFIEPVAIKTGMWHWFGQTVPFQNYASWFIVAWALIYLAHKTLPQIVNPAAVGVYTIQLSFFLVMNLVN